MALAATALAAPGAAAPGFISDVTTLSTHQSAEQYAVAVAPDGTAHAVWVEETGTTFLLMAARRPRGGAWTRPVQVDTGSTTQDAEPSVAVDGRGAVVAAWRDYLPGRTGSVIRTATLAGDAWSAGRNLSPTATHAFAPEVAVDARGDAAIVWTEDLGATGRHVAATQRPAGGAWATSDVTTGPGASAATVAMQPSGRTVVLWNQAGTVQTSDRGLDDDVWSPARQLSATNALDLGAVVDRGGSVIAAWRSAGTVGASTIESATRASGAGWGPTSTLASTTTGLAWQLDLGIGESGEALAAWVQSSDGNRRSDLVTSSREDGTWTTEQVASPQAYNSSPTVGFGTGGASVVMWTGAAEQLTSTRTLYAVTRTPGEDWTTPTALATGSVQVPRAAVEPAGHGTLVWSESGGILRTQVFDGVAPRIRSVTAKRFARTGRATVYSASATDLWSAPSVRWRFDGRSSVSGKRVTRTFRSSGIHVVQLTATDAARNTTTRRTTTIVAARKPDLRRLRVDGARLSYRLGAPALVRVTVVRRSGEVVATVLRALDAGRHTMTFRAGTHGLEKGRYAVSMTARNALGRETSPRRALRVEG